MSLSLPHSPASRVYGALLSGFAFTALVGCQHPSSVAAKPPAPENVKVGNSEQSREQIGGAVESATGDELQDVKTAQIEKLVEHIDVLKVTQAQFAAALDSAFQVEVDSARLSRLAGLANVRVPARHLVVMVRDGDGFGCGTERCSGIWIRTGGPDDYIVVAEDRLKRKPWLMEHEYLHFVLQDGGHPPIYRELGIPEYDQ
jgi:hypothetical protein